MKNHCWYNLRINVDNCFLDNYKFPTPHGRYGVWHPRAETVFNRTWLTYMKKIGLPIYSTMIFYRGPYAHTAQAHVDIGKTDPLTFTNFAINWCYGGSESKMVWYKMPPEDTPITYTGAKTPYMSWDIPTLEEVERTHLSETVSLVRTGVPHSIEMGQEPRWVFSARCSLVDNFEWDDIVELLRKKNLLIER